MGRRSEFTDVSVPDEPEEEVSFREGAGKPLHRIRKSLKEALESLACFHDFLESDEQDIDTVIAIVRYRLASASRYLLALQELVPSQEVANCIVYIRGFFFGQMHMKELLKARGALDGGRRRAGEVLEFEHEVGLKTDERTVEDDLFVLGEEQRSDFVRRNVDTALEYVKTLYAKLDHGS